MAAKRFQKAIKRGFDIIASLVILVVFFPCWVLIALGIKLTSEGPVFFTQKRPGLKGKIFTIYKFRTMKLGSEKMIKGKEVMPDDNRITPIGRFLRRTKIDEIPQLLNVLKGEMSLVGPRPERISSLEDYDDETWKRLTVRPGMTGLAQVSGNIYLDLQERYKYDVYYVENFSLWLDIRIIIRTIGVIVLGEEKFVNMKIVDANGELLSKEESVPM
jgi:undecaprenyl phosphate N,N'-diacetylbacillosamine 1-phosphate transferase